MPRLLTAHTPGRLCFLIALLAVVPTGISAQYRVGMRVPASQVATAGSWNAPSVTTRFPGSVPTAPTSLDPVGPTAAEAVRTILGARTNGDASGGGRTTGAVLAAAAGSMVGLVFGVAMTWESNSPTAMVLGSFGASWAGATLGGGAVSGNFGGAAAGSLVGVAGGIAAAFAMGSVFDGGGTLISYSVVHGLITASKALSH